MEKYRSNHNLNSSNRIIFFDVARGLAILFMMMQHCMIMYAKNEGAGSFLGDTFVVLGTAPAAPVFMMVMGVFFLRARDMKATTIRGLKLIALGYVLNLFRFVLPVLISGDYPSSGPDSPIGLLLGIDILQMAGLSMVVMSSIRHRPPLAWLITAVCVALVSPLLWNYTPKSPLLDILWGTHHNVAFPFFPWVIYPLLGMYWGDLFWISENKARFMKLSAIAGAALATMGGVVWLAIDTPLVPLGDYSRSGIQVHLAIIGFVLVWFWIYSCIEGSARNTRTGQLLVFWSKNVTTIYCIQWLLYGWGVLLFDYQQLDTVRSASIGMAVILLTHVLTRIYIRISKNKGASRGPQHPFSA